MNKYEFIAFFLAGLGFVIKKIIDYSFEQRRLQEQWYEKTMILLRSFYQPINQEEKGKREEKRQYFLEHLDIGWIYLPDKILNSIYEFLDSIHTDNSKVFNQGRTEYLYSEIVASIREEVFSNNIFRKIFKRTHFTHANYKHLGANRSSPLP